MKTLDELQIEKELIYIYQGEKDYLRHFESDCSRLQHVKDNMHLYHHKMVIQALRSVVAYDHETLERARKTVDYEENWA